MTDSNKEYDLLDLDRDLPTTEEDVKRLWELSQQLDFTSMRDVNRLVAPGWTIEKAKSGRLFCDDDEPFEL